MNAALVVSLIALLGGAALAGRGERAEASAPPAEDPEELYAELQRLLTEETDPAVLRAAAKILREKGGPAGEVGARFLDQKAAAIETAIEVPQQAPPGPGPGPAPEPAPEIPGLGDELSRAAIEADDAANAARQACPDRLAEIDRAHEAFALAALAPSGPAVALEMLRDALGVICGDAPAVETLATLARGAADEAARGACTSEAAGRFQAEAGIPVSRAWDATTAIEAARVLGAGNVPAPCIFPDVDPAALEAIVRDYLPRFQALA